MAVHFIDALNALEVDFRSASSVDTAVQLSIAVSLKRIADELCGHGSELGLVRAIDLLGDAIITAS